MSLSNASIVITSIASPNPVLQAFAQGAIQHNLKFIVIGDRSSPPDFRLNGCDFYSLDEQKQLDFRLAQNLPERHYSRKNLGYLLAMQFGSQMILESDDDNYPLADFWLPRHRQHHCPLISHQGWVNVYSYFSDEMIWPRGLPLEYVQSHHPDLSAAPIATVTTPIQQGLANDNPDVDAVFRLTRPLPHYFAANLKVALGVQSWCPFNSQNTCFFQEAFPLLYLPSYCSFRMTDIWRSFVAQRIAWENNWSLLFESPTVSQERNHHNLLKDFQDEIPGYLNNALICRSLESLVLKPGLDAIMDNLWQCYEQLVRISVIDSKEMNLLEAWIEDINQFTTVEKE